MPARRGGGGTGGPGGGPADRRPTATTTARPARTPTRPRTALGWRSRTRSSDYWAQTLPDQAGTAVRARRRSRPSPAPSTPAAAGQLGRRAVLLPARPDDLPRHHVLRRRAGGAARRPGRRLRRALRASPTSTATTSRTCSAPWARSRPSRARPATPYGWSSRPTATPGCGPSGAHRGRRRQGVRSSSLDRRGHRAGARGRQGRRRRPDPAAPGPGQPRAWTHGSAESRVRWFQTGFEEGTLDACDTFASGAL